MSPVKKNGAIAGIQRTPGVCGGAAKRGRLKWQSQMNIFTSAQKMATAFGVRLLGTALVVISGFYRLQGQKT